MPNVEYFAPWFRSEGMMRSMPYERWQALSPHAQRISRYAVCQEGETVVGAGFLHPKAKVREQFKENQFDAMGEKAKKEYLNRL